MAFLRTLIAVTTLLFVFAAPALAQGTKIVVIDQARIMRDSKAGNDIRTKVTNIENQMKSELQPTATQLETQGKALQAKTANMTPEAQQADTALRTEFQAFLQKRQQYEQDRGIRAQELALTERKAWNTFFQSLQPVLQEVVNENGADIMMDRSEVVFSSPSVDVTGSVISKLDAKTPTVAVTRERMPQQQAAQ
ncbi:MAG: OmpH family outer membrane protein [Pseudomonadota bacterium]